MEQRVVQTENVEPALPAIVPVESHNNLQSAIKQSAVRHSAPAVRPRVVIVGAGFGGLNAAKALGNSDLSVLIVDRNNYHGFWPLLYQVATAGLEPEAIAYPVRAIVRSYKNVDYRMAEVTGADFAAKQLLTSVGPIPYDYLILAAGSANNYFGNQQLADNTLGMKDIDDAERLRNHLLHKFELAAAEPNAERRRQLMTIAIVGGGPTGVELAGAVAELIRQVLRRDFPALDVQQARVLLIESGPTLLNTFPEKLQQSARRQLERLGAEVLTGMFVSGVENDVISFKDGSTVPAATVVWAAGVRAAALADALGVPQGRGARVQVEPTLRLPEHPEVFVIGDMAYLEGYKGNLPYPMVAPVAIQQGELAAQNILAASEKRSLRRFRYTDKGQMATIGRRAAVLDAMGMRISGRLAWLGWLVVHIVLLIGFRNRLIVLTNWAINYLTYDRGVRLITRNEC